MDERGGKRESNDVRRRENITRWAWFQISADSDIYQQYLDTI